ncbi:lipopolysaccharide heptosyltransferase II [Methylomonas sp. HYX-M1]|uniref:lipopolysaccharide heptosyltransferase II n=1 Tax=Methylomonas sp. HYX-M1 TaxID=3139307 RepID=UPI00345B5BBF
MLSAENFLIVGPSWVGDMVMAQSLFITLKQHYPACTIDVLAPGWSLPLLQRMPEVRRGIAMPVGHGRFGLAERWRLGRALRGQYGRALVLPNSWKSALLPFFAEIDRRTGFFGEWRYGLLNDVRRLDRQHLPQTVQRFVTLGLEKPQAGPPACPQPKLVVSAEQKQAAATKYAVDIGNPVVALCPGAEYGPAKRWPVEHFAQLGRCLAARGWQVWLFGSEKDAAIAGKINALSGQSFSNFAGKTSLADAVDLMSLADVVVSNDSGLMHVAAALDKKLVALYGSSDPGFTPPLHPAAQIVRLGLECSPCFRRECPLGHTHCLTEISPDQVLQAMDA